SSSRRSNILTIQYRSIKDALIADMPESEHAISEFVSEFEAARYERNDINHRIWRSTEALACGLSGLICGRLRGWRARDGRRSPHPRFRSLKKSLPLSSMTMKAGKSTTSMRQIASMPSSGYSMHSTFLMQCSARFAAAPHRGEIKTVDASVLIAALPR